jgi:hypothetical protein
MTTDVIKVVASPNYYIVAEFETGDVRRFDMRRTLTSPRMQHSRSRRCSCVPTSQMGRWRGLRRSTFPQTPYTCGACQAER